MLAAIGNDRLEAIRHSLDANEEVPHVRVRELLNWYQAERRGVRVVYQINRQLTALGIQTVPDFEGVYLDSRISFSLRPQPTEPVAVGETHIVEASAQLEAGVVVIGVGEAYIAGAAAEPAFRISRLEAADRPPLSVPPTCSLTEAVTLMLRHGYSQLPVMTNQRDLKGVISWESIAGRLTLSEARPEAVKDYMVAAKEVNSTESLFSVISYIVDNSHVFVRGPDRTITGIITTTDLSLQFQQASEPFLLLAEIENHIRSLIDGKFTEVELAAAKNPGDDDRVIETVADLTFGEYVRILETPALWEKTGIKVSRAVFVNELERVRTIRNDVMHFDPDGISPEDHELLRQFVKFLHDVRRLAT